ncbi:MAG: hypothetical protein MHM6MM_003867 [Cercozoa sp. M6MM]
MARKGRKANQKRRERRERANARLREQGIEPKSHQDREYPPGVTYELVADPHSDDPTAHTLRLVSGTPDAELERDLQGMMPDHERFEREYQERRQARFQALMSNQFDPNFEPEQYLAAINEERFVWAKGYVPDELIAAHKLREKSVGSDSENENDDDKKTQTDEDDEQSQKETRGAKLFRALVQGEKGVQQMDTAHITEDYFDALAEEGDFEALDDDFVLQAMGGEQAFDQFAKGVLVDEVASEKSEEDEDPEATLINLQETTVGRAHRAARDREDPEDDEDAKSDYDDDEGDFEMHEEHFDIDGFGELDEDDMALLAQELGAGVSLERVDCAFDEYPEEEYDENDIFAPHKAQRAGISDDEADDDELPEASENWREKTVEELQYEALMELEYHPEYMNEMFDPETGMPIAGADGATMSADSAAVNYALDLYERKKERQNMDTEEVMEAVQRRIEEWHQRDTQNPETPQQVDEDLRTMFRGETRDEWDCETILTTRTNLENRPGVLSAGDTARSRRRRRRKQQQQSEQSEIEAASKSTQRSADTDVSHTRRPQQSDDSGIRVTPNLHLDLYGAGHETQFVALGFDDFPAAGNMTITPLTLGNDGKKEHTEKRRKKLRAADGDEGAKRSKKESKAEKKARKAAAKQIKREIRQRKKESRERFKKMESAQATRQAQQPATGFRL